MDPLISEILKLGPAGFIAAVFLYLWREERKERQALQKEGTERYKATTDALSAASNAMTASAAEDKALKDAINELLTIWKVRDAS